MSRGHCGAGSVLYDVSYSTVKQGTRVIQALNHWGFSLLTLGRKISNLEFKQERKKPNKQGSCKKNSRHFYYVPGTFHMFAQLMHEGALRWILIGWYSHFTEEEVEALGLAQKGGARL